MDNIEQLIMPSRKGWTATVGYDHLTGEPTDIEVNEGYMANSPFADEGWSPAEVQLDSEALARGEETEGDQMIIDGLIELYPDIDDIMDFAVDAYGEDMVAIYDDAVDSGDWSKVNEFLEQWSQEFRDSQPSISHEEQQVYDDLMDAEPEGLEAAYELLQLAEQANDPAESAVLQMSAAFHKGDITAQDAIQQMLSRYPKEQLLNILDKHDL